MRGHAAHIRLAHDGNRRRRRARKQVMETKMTTPLDPIRRLPDGSIDFDRYRADIHALRHQAMEDASRLGAAMKIAAAVAVMLVAIAIAPSSQSDDASCQSCAKPGRTAASLSLISSHSARHDAAAVPQLF
jgi:hypothetical protein